MRHRMKHLPLIGLLLVLGATFASAEIVTLTVHFTNLGEPLEHPKHGRFYLYEAGDERRERYLAWGHAERPARIEAGVYDLVLRYDNDGVTSEKVLTEFELSEDREHIATFEIPIAYLTLELSADGQPIPVHSASVEVHRAGTRGKPLRSGRPGRRLTLRPGSYDIEVRYRDLEGMKSTWLEAYSLSGEQLESVEIGTAPAEFRVVMTARGEPIAAGDGDWELRRSGSGDLVAQGRAGEFEVVPSGIYDVSLYYLGEEGEMRATLEAIEVRGETEQAHEWIAAPNRVTVMINNRGRALDSARFEIFPVGDVAVPVAQGLSGDEVALESGRYDLRAHYRKRSVTSEGWQRSLQIEEDGEIVVDLDFATATIILDPPRRVRRKLDSPVVWLLIDESLSSEAQRSIWRVVDATAGSDATIERREYSNLASELTRLSAMLDEEERTTVIALSDQWRSDDQSACDPTARLIRSGRLDALHTVGVDLLPEQSQGVDCLGSYDAAVSERSLRRILRGLLLQATGDDRGRVSALLPGQNRLVGAGDLGKPLHLPEGQYDLVVRVGQKRYHWAEISVQGEQRYKAGATP